MQYYVLIADRYVHILLTYRQIPRLPASYFLDTCILRFLVFICYYLFFTGQMELLTSF
jgi:hypothetical protein